MQYSIFFLKKKKERKDFFFFFFVYYKNVNSLITQNSAIRRRQVIKIAKNVTVGLNVKIKMYLSLLLPKDQNERFLVFVSLLPQI